MDNFQSFEKMSFALNRFSFFGVGKKKTDSFFDERLANEIQVSFSDTNHGFSSDT